MTRTVADSKNSVRRMKIVEWSEEDQCYVGRCPELMFGGVHGSNERKVFAELCEVVHEWIASEKDTNFARRQIE